MDVLFLILLVLAFVCFGAAAFGVASRVNLMSLGLLFWVLVPLIQTAQLVVK